MSDSGDSVVRSLEALLEEREAEVERLRAEVREQGTHIAATNDRLVAALDQVERQWQPIETCPSDGTPFLARCITTYDEYDEDDRLIGKNQKTIEVWLVQKIFGGITAIPYKASFWQNVEWTHWQPVPSSEVSSAERNDG